LLRAAFVPQTIAAEDRLHDLGVISMISSDSQAMGRVGGSHHSLLADSAQDEDAVRRAQRAIVRRTTSAPCATSPNTPSTLRLPMASRMKSVR